MQLLPRHMLIHNKLRLDSGCCIKLHTVSRINHKECCQSAGQNDLVTSFVPDFCPHTRRTALVILLRFKITPLGPMRPPKCI